VIGSHAGAPGLVSRCVPLNEPGAVQGVLASLGSLAGIVALLVALQAFKKTKPVATG
jgi:hypothetical protein